MKRTLRLVVCVGEVGASCPARWDNYTIVSPGQATCPSGTAIDTVEDCTAAMRAFAATCAGMCTAPECIEAAGEVGTQSFQGPSGCLASGIHVVAGELKTLHFEFNANPQTTAHDFQYFVCVSAEQADACSPASTPAPDIPSASGAAAPSSGALGMIVGHRPPWHDRVHRILGILTLGIWQLVILESLLHLAFARASRLPCLQAVRFGGDFLRRQGFLRENWICSNCSLGRSRGRTCLGHPSVFVCMSSGSSGPECPMPLRRGGFR